jgi:hypothetical protein
MTSSLDLRQLISILDEEGYGVIAGELLAEISLGQELEKKEVPGGEDDADSDIRRVPMDEEDQLAEAMRFLRLRLVEPVKAFAEAERIAGEIADAPGVRIRFIDPDERYEIEPLSSRDVGDAALAEELDELLERLPLMLDPPSSPGA